MKTKEEYIDNCLPLQDDEYLELPSGVDIGWIKKNSLPEAFSNFAKQQAIEFYKYLHDIKDWPAFFDLAFGKPEEQLYRQFIENQSKETNNG